MEYCCAHAGVFIDLNPSKLDELLSEKEEEDTFTLKITKENPLLEWWDEFCKRF